MINHYVTVGIATLLAAALIGCGNEHKDARTSDAANVNPSATAKDDRRHDAPFEYKLVSKEEKMLAWGPQVIVNLETTNDIAKNATKSDLRKLWQQMAPTLGDRRVFLYLKTSVPGVPPWAVISRIKTDQGWKLDFTIHEFGIDAEPYHFFNEIDRAVRNQGAMIVTLPMVNHLNEKLVRHGWTLEQRDENYYSAKLRTGIQSVSVTLTPETIDVYALLAEGNTFTDTVDLVFAELGIASGLKKELYSVIGSPEYVRVAPGKPQQWTWTFGEIEVTYIRLPSIDNLRAGYAR